tara:strand:+ start:4437 stop:5510 length:1074 start_codon:yes stop_codon:yes gene_type:complete
MSIYDKLEGAVRRFEQLTEKMGDPSLYDRQDEFKKLSTERSHLEEIVKAYREFKQIRADIDEAKKILREEKDEDMREMAKEELSEKEQQIPILEQELQLLMLPKDPMDDKNVMVEIRAGAGGDEASIFVGDVWRMYTNFCKDLGFKTNMVSISESDQGIKEVIFSVTGDKVYSKLKFESGVHRVQRVPKTEAQGRIHTSTITVAVMPEAEDVDIDIKPNELQIDVFRSSGAGGQSVNTTDSAVRITHLPTGLAVACQQERSQLKNKELAMAILKSRLLDAKVQEANAAEAAERKSLVGTGDRSERIRTYNYPQGRVTDHRIGLTLYNLERIIAGDLAEVTNALVAHNQAELLKGEDE